MKKTAKTFSTALSSLLVFSLVLSACSSAKTEEKKTDATTTTPAGTTQAPAKADAKHDPIKLKFTYWGSPDEKKAIEGATKKFTEKYPWITVEDVQIPNADYNTKLTAMAAGNDIPDTGYMTGDLGDTWAKEGKFVNLFDMLAKDPEVKKENYLDYVWYKQSPDNAWGISTAGETFGLFYRKDLLEKAGVAALPTTADTALNWDQFVETAKKLTIDKNGKNASEAGFDPKSIKQYGVTFETWNEPLNNFIYSNGGDWASKDGKNFTLNSPESTEAIQKLADLINVYHVAPSPLAAKSLPAMNVALQSGIAAMAIGGQWMNLDLGNAKVKYDIGVLPKLKKSVTVALSGATVLFKNSKHPEEAWMLFKWMSDPAGAIDLYSGGLWMPTMKAWYTDPALIVKWVDANPAAHPPGFKDAMMNQLLKNGVPGSTYYLKNQAKVTSTVISGLDAVWLGSKTAKDALNDIAAKVQPDFQGRYDATP
ncbi:ABC transporter substrate-binding protein [Paenibacillus sp. Soil787]|uniref:ABC transporter substrate-binding protein n=1 Tax=Paenibacillus sp. Soil787 TaxID=1736411 RepID=UPI0006F95B06|nr:sugar ABC transporter substrate-binding protein [Paenibacillus sp. Soil787]KRF41881.1 ABC transporter substrate-binding protein [Paenibacillus sp. Soil787]